MEPITTIPLPGPPQPEQPEQGEMVPRTKLEQANDTRASFQAAAESLQFAQQAYEQERQQYILALENLHNELGVSDA